MENPKIARKYKAPDDPSERFSPGWIKAIPRWLARGIWDAIEDGISGKEHTNAKANARRKRQIEMGIIRPTATVEACEAHLAMAADRASARERARNDASASRDTGNNGEGGEGVTVGEGRVSDRKIQPVEEASGAESAPESSSVRVQPLDDKRGGSDSADAAVRERDVHSINLIKRGES